MEEMFNSLGSIGDRPDNKDAILGLIKYKNELLQKIGLEIDNIKNGCPFCQYYLRGNQCGGCPIAKRYSGDFTCEFSICNYYVYYSIYIVRGVCNQQAAIDFYVELISIAKESGYEPDFSLMWWD